jgi:hypothetical protein
LVGGSAVVALGALGVAYGSNGSGSPSSVAGSGDAPANTTYVQPTEGAMSMGATATAAPPASTLATSVAVPAITPAP